MNRAGFRETLSTGETEYYILPAVFQNEICAGLSHVQAARSLAEAGLLKRGEGRHVAQYKTLPEMGLRRVYVVSLPNDDDQDGEKLNPI
jgi:uncharacterized protein (DUF927 family)